MTKGYGDQLWVSGTVGFRYRNLVNFNDTTSTLSTYKLSIDNNCTTSYRALPEFLTLDMFRNKSYCVDSILKIYWSSAFINQVNLLYSTNGGAAYTTIATGISAAQGFYNFNILNAGIAGNILFKIEGQGSQSMDTMTVAAFAKSFSITISGNTAVNSGQSVLLTSVSVNAGSSPTFQWEDSTETHSWVPIANATSATLNYIPVATGNKVRCKISSSQSCATPGLVISNALTFTVNTATAINPVSGDKYGIHLYPNPVNSMFTLDTLKLSDKWDVLDIISIDGKNISSYEIRNQSRLTVNVSKLNAGLYIAILRRKTGKHVYLKFIKI
jgi:hypothetical protein